MKPDIQIQAERVAKQFTSTARKPVVIEFAGVPKSGKTTTLIQLQSFLERCGFRTDVVVERASICPIRDKKHFNFNVWTACTTLAQLLEKTQDPPRVDDPHILFLDRGLFDSLCWLTMMERLARIRTGDRDLIERFIRINDWRKRISAVILMMASPEDALEREQRPPYIPVEGKQHSIMNPEVLKQIRDTCKECADRLKKDFRIYTIDTSYGETKNCPSETVARVVDITLSLVEEQIKEEVLVLPKNVVKTLFGHDRSLSFDKAASLVQAFSQSGEYKSRDEAEADDTLVQALPVVIIRNASGSVLQMRRRERSEDNPLHHKIVIWAGGHVRREDAANGDALIRCAMRELSEELRLNVEPGDLRLLGAVYFDEGHKTSQHVAMAYAWQAKTDDVAIVLSRVEFFERRGTSLSGSFINIGDLTDNVNSGKISEPWSAEIVRAYLAQGTAYRPLLI